MLKNQLFGVEVEMTGITREKAARLVAGVLGTTPSHPESNCYHTRTIADQAARKWKIMRDTLKFCILSNAAVSHLTFDTERSCVI